MEVRNQHRQHSPCSAAHSRGWIAWGYAISTSARCRRSEAAERGPLARPSPRAARPGLWQWMPVHDLQAAVGAPASAGTAGGLQSAAGQWGKMRMSFITLLAALLAEIDTDKTGIFWG